MEYSIKEIAGIIGADAQKLYDAPVSILLTDSRRLSFPEQSLFFALQTKTNDGHNYIQGLYKLRVRNFVVSTFLPEFESMPEANFLVVKDTLKALQKLAAHHRKRFNIPVIGITGSNGKTIVKEFLYQLLHNEFNIVRSPRSYNSQLGVPLSVWQMSDKNTLGIFEAGISQPDEMERLQPIIAPTIGVITNIGEAHQENFISSTQKCLEKLTLFNDCEAIIYDGDDAFIANCIESACLSHKAITWSRTDSEAPLYIESIKKLDSETIIRCTLLGFDRTYTIPFTDDASIENAIHCMAVMLYLKPTSVNDIEKFKRLEPVAMRLDVKQGINNCLLINDTYNSDINSLDIALDFMNRRPDCAGRKRTLILSDIEQAGGAPEDLYGRVGRLVAMRGVEKFIGVGPCLSAVQGLFGMEACFYRSTDELLGSGVLDTLHDEVILIKGARSFRFDVLTEHLALKVHETTLEVNLNAVVDNLNYYRSFMKPETKMVCMVKASAYGAGAVEIAKTLQDHQVDYLAVAVADEGVDLRKAGITANIMIMNPEMSSFPTLFEYDLEPEVYSFRLLEALIHEAEKEGGTHFPIHVKLDTGMHRLGFDPEKDMPLLVERLKRQSAVIPRSVFSHFVGSDSDDFDAFSARQYELFLKGSAQLQQAYSHKILRHICNSAGIEHFPDRHLEMVRLGLGLYGINSRNNEILHNISTLKTTILQIHEVPKEDTVGYSRKGRLTRDSRIAALPIGYADGLDRKLGCGRAYCLVNGRRAPYVGNICMDVCMIDVTDIDCREGDTAIIFGDDLPVTVLSDAVGTIPYEILTGVSARVKRVYYQD